MWAGWPELLSQCRCFRPWEFPLVLYRWDCVSRCQYVSLTESVCLSHVWPLPPPPLPARSLVLLVLPDACWPVVRARRQKQSHMAWLSLRLKSLWVSQGHWLSSYSVGLVRALYFSSLFTWFLLGISTPSVALTPQPRDQVTCSSDWASQATRPSTYSCLSLGGRVAFFFSTLHWFFTSAPQ